MGGAQASIALFVQTQRSSSVPLVPLVLVQIRRVFAFILGVIGPQVSQQPQFTFQEVSTRSQLLHHFCARGCPCKVTFRRYCCCCTGSCCGCFLVLCCYRLYISSSGSSRGRFFGCREGIFGGLQKLQNVAAAAGEKKCPIESPVVAMVYHG